MLSSIRLGEVLILVTGFLILFNVWFIGSTGNFDFWILAKILYVIGVALFILDR